MGNDILIGSAGSDVLAGGDGSDVASYGESSNGVVADLAQSSNNAGDAAGDTYSGIEALWGSNFNDTLRGDQSGNNLSGGGGLISLMAGVEMTTSMVGRAAISSSLGQVSVRM